VGDWCWYLEAQVVGQRLLDAQPRDEHAQLHGRRHAARCALPNTPVRRPHVRKFNECA
jgi:hypothetical protein